MSNQNAPDDRTEEQRKEHTRLDDRLDRTNEEYLDALVFGVMHALLALTSGGSGD